MERACPNSFCANVHQSPSSEHKSATDLSTVFLHNMVNTAKALQAPLLIKLISGGSMDNFGNAYTFDVCPIGFASVM